MRDVYLIIGVLAMFICYTTIVEIIERCKRRKQNPRYGCIPNKPTPPPAPPQHFIVTDCDDCCSSSGLCKSEPTQVDPVPVLRSYRYKNIWYDVTVQAQDPEHACQLINQIFKEKKQPLICFADQLKIVE